MLSNDWWGRGKEVEVEVAKKQILDKKISL